MDRKLCVRMKNEGTDAILENIKIRTTVKESFQGNNYYAISDLTRIQKRCCKWYLETL
jgi:hypothetical protein